MLVKMGISEKRILLLSLNGKRMDATLSNIRKVLNSISTISTDEIRSMVDAIALNTGRHTITTLVTNAGVDLDMLNAFMGHNVNGGEHLGEISMNDTANYLITFRSILEEVAGIYSLKDVLDVD